MSVVVRRFRLVRILAGMAAGIGGLAVAQQAAQHEPDRGLGPAVTTQAPGAGHADVLFEETASASMDPRDPHGDARQFFLRKRLPLGMTEYPTQQMLDAYRQSLAMPLHSTMSAAPAKDGGAALVAAPEQLFWDYLGPGNFGGRTRALAILGTSQTMAVAGIGGGVWFTANGGASWSPTGDLMANLAVSSLAVDPNSLAVILAGTGEGYQNYDAIAGAGIFKTMNGGGSWTQIASTANADFQFVNDIIYKPGGENVIYAATGTGLMRSIDGGASWTKVINAASANGCMKIVYRSDADTAVAACGTFAENDGATGLWTSTNASAASPTWTHVLGAYGSNATLFAYYMGRTSLAIAPSNQSIIYALVSCSGASCGYFENGSRLVLRSSDGGLTWAAAYEHQNFTNVLNPSNGDLLLTNARLARQQQCGLAAGHAFQNLGWYDNVIAVDPVDPTKVWVGGIDLWRSDDSGATWGLASYGWKDTADSHYVHANNHGIYFDKGYDGTTNQTMFVTNDGGIFKTTNSRAAVGTGTNNDGTNSICGSSNLPAIAWSNLNNGYGVAQFNHGSVYPDGTQYFGGVQANGTVRGSDGNPNGWTKILDGSYTSDGGYTAIDKTTSGSNTVLYAERAGISIQKSTDNGAHFTCATQGIVDCLGNTYPNDYGQFINPFTIDPNNSSNLWTSGSFLWRSTNGATSWIQASTNMLDDGSGPCGTQEGFSAEKVAPGNSNFVVAGTDCGHIFNNRGALSASASTAWQFTKPRAGYVADIAFDPNNNDKVYVVYSTIGGTHVWKSTNGAQSFTGLDGTNSVLPNVPVTAVAVSPFNGNTIYVGTDIGVFVTNDGGANWARENTGFSNAPTDALVFNPSGPTGQELYAFTHGRGVFRAQISNTASSTTVLGSNANPSTYNQSVGLTATVSGGSGTPTGTVDFYDGSNTIAAGVALVAGVATTNTTALAAGTHNLSAVYSGSATYGISVGNVTQTVNQGSTTTTMTGDVPDPTSVGEDVTVSGVVGAPGGGTPTGTITVSSAGSTGCTITLPGTQCKLTYTTAGAKSITGIYSGDNNFTGSMTAAGRSHEVDATSTITTITSDNPDPSAIGQTVKVVVSVVATPGTGSPSSGSVTVTGTNTTGCSFSRPNTSCNLSFTATGAQTISAAYGGNTSYLASSTQSTTAHTVVGSATTTTITADTPDASVVGQPVSVSASVSSGSATGTITVTGTNTDGCTIVLPAPSCNAVFTASGAQTLDASYGGDANFASSSTTSSTAHTVNPAQTHTMLSSDTPDPSVTGQIVTISASVAASAPGAGTPTGTITISGDGTAGCTITLPATSCAAVFTSVGAAQLVSAQYNGDGNFLGSGNLSGVHTTNQAQTATTITADTPDPSVPGQTVTVFANVVALAPGSGTPTGTITVTGTHTTGCTITLPAPSCPLTFTAGGAQTLDATYNGDANFLGSTTLSSTPHSVDGIFRNGFELP